MTDKTTNLLDDFQELNLSNYGPDDVAELNNWVIEAYGELGLLAQRVERLEALLRRALMFTSIAVAEDIQAELDAD